MLYGRAFEEPRINVLPPVIVVVPVLVFVPLRVSAPEPVLTRLPVPLRAPAYVPSVVWFKTSAELLAMFPWRLDELTANVPAVIVVPPE